MKLYSIAGDQADYICTVENQAEAVKEAQEFCRDRKMKSGEEWQFVTTGDASCCVFAVTLVEEYKVEEV